MSGSGRSKYLGAERPQHLPKERVELSEQEFMKPLNCKLLPPDIEVSRSGW